MYFAFSKIQKPLEKTFQIDAFLDHEVHFHKVVSLEKFGATTLASGILGTFYEKTCASKIEMFNVNRHLLLLFDNL